MIETHQDIKTSMKNIYGFTIKDNKIEAPKMDLPIFVEERIKFFGKYSEEGMTYIGALTHILAYGDHKELEIEFAFGTTEEWLKPSEEFIEWRDLTPMSEVVIATALIYGTGSEEVTKEPDIEILTYTSKEIGGFITHTANVKTERIITEENEKEFVGDVSVKVGYHPGGYGLYCVQPVIHTEKNEYSLQWETSNNCD